MKVFLSWSGEKSHKIAMVFRDWLPSVIQFIVPYVSSEDIDKGARWSTDIARELENSTFGILSVTKDNINAPWLTFEAGALSKTMDKSFVVPFLFDIKRSEVDGPLLQFQSTIFEKHDIKKLIKTLNKACGDDALPSDRLNKAFEVWYPTLEEELLKIKKLSKGDSDSHKDNAAKELQSSEILEEILELTRINQKLLRNPEGPVVESIANLQEQLSKLLGRLSIYNKYNYNEGSRELNIALIRDVLHKLHDNNIKFQTMISLFKDDFPWIYSMGIKLIEILEGRKSKTAKISAIKQYANLINTTFNHPIMRENYYNYTKLYKDILFILKQIERDITHAPYRG